MTSDELHLVREYAAYGSEEAFKALVSRYIDLVHSAALRRVEDAHLAEEITQVVFIILSRKAGSLGPKVVLSGWLYRTALFVAADALKRERRRQQREQEAYMQSFSDDAATEKAWQELSPLLDEGMARLGGADRDALVLRFFEGRTLGEVGSALGLSEEAAKKRVQRAVERLRLFFAKRGIAATAAVLAGAMSVHSVQAAPAGLAAGVTAAAAGKGVAAGGSTLALLKGSLNLIAWAKTKFALAATAAVILAVGSTAVAVKGVQAARVAGYPDIQGAWQGTFDSPPIKCVFVLKIVRTNGVYQAVGDGIDYGISNLQLDQFSYRYPFVHAGFGELVDFKLNPEATEMSGTIPHYSGAGLIQVPVVLKRTSTPETVINLTEVDYAAQGSTSLQGYWKGTLHAGPSALPVVLKIAGQPDGSFRGQYDSPFEGRSHIPVSVDYERPRVKLTLRGPGGTFDGTLSGTGAMLGGTWSNAAGAPCRAVFERTDPAEDLRAERGKTYAHTNRNQAQGHWKGIIKANNNGKTVEGELFLHVAKMADGRPSAALDSPSELVMGMEATKVLVSPPNVWIEWKYSGHLYRATLKGGEMTGTFSVPGGQSLPLVFKRL